jgi:hypothetical protein
LQMDTAMLFGTANYLRVWRYDICQRRLESPVNSPV